MNDSDSAMQIEDMNVSDMIQQCTSIDNVTLSVSLSVSASKQAFSVSISLNEPPKQITRVAYGTVGWLWQKMQTMEDTRT